ncbi:hypothetical protein H8D36_03340 [archaeon]|nr:hypothetical protein [archaeon]
MNPKAKIIHERIRSGKLFTREEFEELHGHARRLYMDLAYAKAKSEWLEDLHDTDNFYCHCCKRGTNIHPHHIYAKGIAEDWWYFQKENFYPVGSCCHPVKVHGGVRFAEIEKKLKEIKQKNENYKALHKRRSY